MIPKVNEQDIIGIFNEFCNDDQDSVRMQGIDNCIQLAKVIPPAKINAYIVPVIKKFSEDSSWRIRYMVADRIMDLANSIGHDHAKEKFLVFYCKFLEDKESEVRTAACGNVAGFCQILESHVIVARIVPLLKVLQTD